MSLVEFSLLAFASLFVVVDPIAIVPAFLAMTSNNSSEAQERMARLACAVAAGVLVLFALTGPWLFRVLGITLPAFQIAGSILLLRIALDMLYAQRSRDRESNEELEVGAAKDDIAITPLGVPMLAGPGAISTALILLNQARGWAQHAALLVAILAVCLASYLALRIAINGVRYLNPLVLRLLTRLMGLLLAAIAIQFAINGLEQTPFFTPAG